MTIMRGLAFSLLVPLLNMTAITVAAFCTTLVQRGLSADLMAQFAHALRSWFSLGMLILVLLAALPALGGWCVLRLSASSSSSVRRVAFFGLGGMIAALMPALLAIIVIGPLLGLVVVLVATGLAAGLMLRGASEPWSRDPRSQRRNLSSAPQTGFGRRVR